jgi:hypothetical protein
MVSRTVFVMKSSFWLRRSPGLQQLYYCCVRDCCPRPLHTQKLRSSSCCLCPSFAITAQQRPCMSHWSSPGKFVPSSAEVCCHFFLFQGLCSSLPWINFQFSASHAVPTLNSLVPSSRWSYANRSRCTTIMLGLGSRYILYPTSFIWMTNLCWPSHGDYSLGEFAFVWVRW